MTMMEDLSGCIRSQILGRLPTQEAILASQISSAWRNLWKTCQSLNFNYGNHGNNFDFNAFIRNCLHQHQGYIHELNLTINSRITSEDLSSYFNHIRLQKLSIESPRRGNRVLIPEAVYLCKDLRFLKLKGRIAVKKAEIFTQINGFRDEHAVASSWAFDAELLQTYMVKVGGEIFRRNS
ncbi:PREDICTED: FBD-associated F-box protein At1g66310-like [Camelina sativa]|uniref:FBD-associated F-box protein At1g66310-like n=1 Tax=Camelina sativa TaxID=90675 RepID=A0ABM0UTN1_CAMSA|nr:PREDICTED: FBD-associated F-box protein At1g66310-like [Camelina sativa]